MATRPSRVIACQRRAGPVTTPLGKALCSRRMDAANPYAPPLAPLSDAGAADPEPELPSWRLEGATLLVRHGATLPDVCLFTRRADHARPAPAASAVVDAVVVPDRGGAVPDAGASSPTPRCARRRTSKLGWARPGASGAGSARCSTLGAVIDTIALLLVMAVRDEGDSMALVGFLHRCRSGAGHRRA